MYGNSAMCKVSEPALKGPDTNVSPVVLYLVLPNLYRNQDEARGSHRYLGTTDSSAFIDAGLCIQQQLRPAIARTHQLPLQRLGLHHWLPRQVSRQRQLSSL